MEKDEFPLLVGKYLFKCFYQRGSYPKGRFKQSDEGIWHVAVCECGRGITALSLDDAVEQLKKSYTILRDNGHSHREDTPRFNIILGSNGDWIMGIITDTSLLDDLEDLH